MSDGEDDALAAELDDEFDDWGDASQQQAHGEGDEADADADAHDREDGSPSSSMKVDGSDGSEEGHRGRACEEGDEPQSSGHTSSGWGSDADVDAMAEQLLKDITYPEREPTPSEPEPKPGQPPQQQQEGDGGQLEDQHGEPGHASPAKRRRLHGGAGVVTGAVMVVEGTKGDGAAGAAAVATVAAVAATGESTEDAGGSSCSHPTYWAGMCVVCGAPKPEDTPSSADPSAPGGPAAAPQRKLPSRGRAAGAASSPPAGASGAGTAGAPAAAAAAMTRIKHMHASAHLELSSSEAERLRQQEVVRLLAARRLVLILDLDHTLLNSVRLCDVAPEHVPALNAILEQEAGNPRRLLYCLRDKNLWTKLRPFVFEFLDAVKDQYELHIYTMGDRHYAAEVRRLLDPAGRLFASVISQNESTSTLAKHLDVALVADRLVVILDDTEQVWPHHARNLIKVERYHFFPASTRQFHTGAASLLEQGCDESSQQGMLAACLKVLQDVHRSFFAGVPEGPPARGSGAEGASAAADAATDPAGASGEARQLPPGAGAKAGSSAAGGAPSSALVSAELLEQDVRYHLSQRRERILQGCHVVFSHCWPTAFKTPYHHPLWRMAEALGAECSGEYQRDVTTHVVAANSGTEKVQMAKAHGKLVVGPEWLQACFFRWERVPEADKPPPSLKSRSDGGAQVGSGGGAAPVDELSAALRAAGGGEAGANGGGSKAAS